MSLEKFRAKVESGQSVAGVLLLGSDSFLREELRGLLVQTFVPEGARAWAVARSSACDVGVDDILQQAQSLPMLAPRQVIIVEEVEAWERQSDDSRDKLVAALEKYLKDPAPFTTLVFEAEKLDARMKLSKVLAERTLVVELTLGGEAGGPMVMKMAREMGAELDAACAAQLLDVVNNDLARARTEIEKLATFAGKRSITPEDVDALVISSKKYEVWALADLLARRKADGAMVFLDNLLRQGQQAPAIVGALAWMYRTLLHAQDMPPGSSASDLMRQVRLRWETADLAMNQARKIPRRNLVDGLQALCEADSRLKKGKPDARVVMEFLVARLTA